jgi:Uma2 family endonuclease
VENERLATALWPDGRLHAAPELIVEVLSPGMANERRDRELKLTLYSRRGVQEYWIVDWQGKRVDVFRRHEAALGMASALFASDRLDSALFPGCSAPLSTLFDGLPAA